VLVTWLYGALTLLFAAYHDDARPGGGFQGGVIIASGAALIFLSA
jgi:multisubunit Na+/H+ antiporter MnhB subunit